jgi:hypothetical protein
MVRLNNKNDNQIMFEEVDIIDIDLEKTDFRCLIIVSFGKSDIEKIKHLNNVQDYINYEIFLTNERYINSPIKDKLYKTWNNKFFIRQNFIRCCVG